MKKFNILLTAMLLTSAWLFFSCKMRTENRKDTTLKDVSSRVIESYDFADQNQIAESGYVLSYDAVFERASLFKLVDHDNKVMLKSVLSPRFIEKAGIEFEKITQVKLSPNHRYVAASFKGTKYGKAMQGLMLWKVADKKGVIEKGFESAFVLEDEQEVSDFDFSTADATRLIYSVNNNLRYVDLFELDLNNIDSVKKAKHEILDRENGKIVSAFKGQTVEVKKVLLGSQEVIAWILTNKGIHVFPFSLFQKDSLFYGDSSIDQIISYGPSTVIALSKNKGHVLTLKQRYGESEKHSIDEVGAYLLSKGVDASTFKTSKDWKFGYLSFCEEQAGSYRIQFESYEEMNGKAVSMQHFDIEGAPLWWTFTPDKNLVYALKQKASFPKVLFSMKTASKPLN